MSLFSWLSPAKKPPVPETESSGLSRMESTKPFPGRPGDDGTANGKPANRKSERMARRELLYVVVRECMSKAGLVSASYKFKVLSLDARGRQFLVMVDLSRLHAGETSRLAEIEAMIAQTAKHRFEIIVTAVYWRMNEHVAVGGQAAVQQPVASRPAPLDAHQLELPVSAPMPLVSQPTPLESAPLSRSGKRYEPIQNDEVEAFRKALATGVSPADALVAAGGATARSFDGTAKHGPQSYTLLTGFEDTELAEGDPPPPALSATQYGDLR